MGRSQGPLTEGGPVALFAGRLRQLRAASELSMRLVAERSGYSRSTVCNAEAGRRLPSWDVASAIVEVCGGAGALATWRAEWDRAAGELKRVSKAERASPAQAPASVVAFVGRTAELARLRALAIGKEDRLAVVHGPGGVGKTTLVIQLAHELAARFPDGLLFADLRGQEDTPLDPAGVLASFLRALGIADERIPSDLEERTALYRTLLASRRVLVVVDNAGNEAQVRPLLAAGARCLTLVTSRSPLLGLDAVRVPVGALPPDQAIGLLRAVVGTDRVNAEPEPALAIVEACGSLPLAVRIAAHRLTMTPSWPIAELAKRLRNERGRLDQLDAGDRSVRSSIAVSYTRLPAPARWLFCRLALVPSVEFTSWVVSILADLPIVEVDRILLGLLDSTLVEATARAGRYRLHDLVRLYAAEQLDLEDRGSQGHHLLTLARWYLNTAAAAGNLLCPRDPHPDIADRLPFHDTTSATTWLDEELTSVLWAIRLNHDGVLDDAIEGLDITLTWYCDLRCRWAELREVAEASLAIARTRQHPAQEAAAINNRGLALYGLGCYDEVIRTEPRALRLAELADDAYEQTNALARLGLAHAALGRNTEALDYHYRDLQLSRAMGDQHGEACARSHAAEVLNTMGRYAEAAIHSRYTLDIMTKLRDERRQAMALVKLGTALSGLGQGHEAATCHQQALDLFTTHDDQWGRGLAHHGLGHAHTQLGNPTQSRRHHQQALEMFTATGDLRRQHQVRNSMSAV